MKKRHRKKKFKKFAFMLSERQMKSLKNYCEARQTTPNKLIKKSIRFYTENFFAKVPDKYHIQHNQLDMFRKDKNTLTLFD
ncbi:MAG: hypothetical protein HN336_04015 [Lentimicrobiaceae bacterium]|jgi:hypothetical protein|nr:hypothetical protein [Lentimicrobiaceae bacterium]MCP4910346.1 hypothetical protein [Bacteroidota bacterium]MBT3454264.1 hypothetical protein [Lentimicrobiaceae bacterium]MBT3817860.1 hypothetical protein [Lentimicrobiaceae bacterium]MBT4060693.1 hypothetical protein [Lentimicrobiaceae bacterium]